VGWAIVYVFSLKWFIHVWEFFLANFCTPAIDAPTHSSQETCVEMLTHKRLIQNRIETVLKQNRILCAWGASKRTKDKKKEKRERREEAGRRGGRWRTKLPKTAPRGSGAVRSPELIPLRPHHILTLVQICKRHTKCACSLDRICALVSAQKKREAA
jgi:hypothetical protein